MPMFQFLQLIHLKKIKVFCLSFCLSLAIIALLSIPKIIGAEAGSSVVINEIAWMGTAVSANDEWLELYNNTDSAVDLTGWILRTADGSPSTTLTGIVAAHGYFLLERTDDETVPGIAADQIYTGALSNTGENLELRDAANSPIDQVNCAGPWFAGDNTSKATMERKDPTVSGNDSTNWQSSQNPAGTPKAQNSSGATPPPIPPGETPTSTEPTSKPNGWTGPTVVNEPPQAEAGPDITALVGQTITFDAGNSYDPDSKVLTYFWNFGDGAAETEEKTTHIYQYPGQYLAALLVSDNELSDLDIIKVNIYSPSVLISEFMPNPTGADEENEWLELFNQSQQITNLSGWQIVSGVSTTKSFIFPENTLMTAGQFLVLSRPISKLTLNNTSGQVQLIYPDGSLASRVNYSGQTKEGFSIAFDGQDYFWTKTPTPGTANLISTTDSDSANKNLSANNPKISSQTAQELPDVSTKNSLSPSQNFSALNPPESSTQMDLTGQPAVSNPTNLTESNNQESPELTAQENHLPSSNFSERQAVSLVNKIQSGNRANLILTLSIIISAGLLVSWGLIIWKKRFG